MKSIYLFIISVFTFLTSFAQSWQDTVYTIEKAFSQYKATNPGIQLAIARNGKIVFSKAWGMADLERNTPLSTISILESGSVAKQFVAASILLLAQQGKLSIDEDVRKYIPELPEYPAAITLRHMLHHTSGLRDWGSIAELTGWPRGKKFYTNDDVFDIIIHQKQLNHLPGAEYIYSNSNYNLMGNIVQRLSGLSLAAFTKQFIFDPAGMTHSMWREDPNAIVPNRGLAYTKTTNGYEMNMPNEYVYGQGGMLTTTDDLIKWNAFYLQGKFGNPSLLPQLTHTDTLNNGALNTYAAGLVVKKVNGMNNISHSGSTASYRAYLESFPDQELSLAILSNTSEFNINDIAAKLRNIFIPNNTESLAKQDTKVVPAKFTVSNIAKYTGTFFSEEVNSNVLVKQLNGNLVMQLRPGQHFTLLPIQLDTFEVKELGGQLVFIKSAKNKIVSMKISVPRARNVGFKKIN